jgi:hypothetical protein
MAPTHSVWGVDGVSLVESSMNHVPVRVLVPQYCPGVCDSLGVEPGSGAGGVGVWHTVGP